MIESKQFLMLPDVQNLIDLQQADGEIRRLKEEIAALPKRVSAIEEKLAGTKSTLEAAKAAIKADEGARRKYETAIQDLQQKISKYRDQSLEVKTNEQYKALMHEIQFAERDIRGHEDKILELMVKADGREKEVKAAEAELRAETAEIEQEKAAARERTAEDERQLAEWSAKRDKARASANPDLLQHYDRLMKHRGTAIAEVREQKCTACSVMLRPQTYNEVRSGEKTVVCDSCQRILYFDPANAPLAQPTKITRRRRPRPKPDSIQAWYFRADYTGENEVFLVFTNAPSDGKSNRRVYEAHTGREIGDTQFASGDYHSAFAPDLAGAIRLNGSWAETELEEWGAELPMVTLDALQRDLDAARAESEVAASAPEHRANEVVSEPAAS